MNAIVSTTKNWGIGILGSLAHYDKVDMARFKELTQNSTVIMGRKTLESLPNGSPLKGRHNIILTTNRDLAIPNLPENTTCDIAHNIHAIPKLIANENPDNVWVIGGDSVYFQLLPYCEKAYVTRFDLLLIVDTYFPNLDKHKDWELVERTEHSPLHTFCIYKNKRPRTLV